ncbi:hypothetical protein HY480_00040 [Candidatus Uhrbacteria bacterium]|nr:hypothetical protein [Candidatus Uhrbacteria bacterium]
MDTLLAQIGYGFVLSGRDVLLSPWWWYTRGALGVLRWAGRTLRGWEHVIGLRFWARNLFVPMFGQTDWQGRLISVAMRLLVLLGRLLQVLIGAIFVAIAIIAYLALPIVGIWLIVSSHQS